MPRRRYPRALAFTLDAARRPSVEIDGACYAVRTFSPVGMGIWVPRHSADNTLAGANDSLGRQLKLTVRIANDAWQAAAVVRHYANGVLGLEFVKPVAPLFDRLAALSAPTQYASDLVLRGEAGAPDPETGFCRVVYSSHDAELVLWYNGMQRLLVALQLRWRGRWVYRELLGGSLTGKSASALATEGHRLSAAELDDADEPAATDLLREAAVVLGALPQPLPATLLWQFLETGEQVYLPETSVPNRRVA